MASAQDHKRAKDGDQGLNTGGMGTFSPSPFYTDDVDKFCKEHVYQKTMDAMKAEGRFHRNFILWSDADTRWSACAGVQCEIWRSRGTGCTSTYEERYH